MRHNKSKFLLYNILQKQSEKQQKAQRQGNLKLAFTKKVMKSIEKQNMLEQMKKDNRFRSGSTPMSSHR